MTTTDRTPPRAPGRPTPRRRSRRRLASGAGVLLVAALLPILGAAPAQAAECTSEVPETTGPPLNLPIGPGCDDPEPPDTALGTITPQPNADHWINQGQVEFTFTGSHADADTDPIEFQCQFYAVAETPGDWTACESPATYEELGETNTTAVYTFKVRAVDSEDDGINLQTQFPLQPRTDLPDYDQTPAEATVRVDTEAPAVFVVDGPYDRDGTGWPVAKRPRVTYTLSASEKVEYTCQLDARAVPCADGRTTLKGIEGGSRTFTVAARDRAGNDTATAVVNHFVMPHNLRKSPDWKRVKVKKAFARDVLQTRSAGDRVKYRVRNIRALTLLAPSGPDLGKIRVRVGNGVWHVVDLGRKKASPRRAYVIRTSSAPLVSGSVLIESLSKKLVQVDALVLPPG